MFGVVRLALALREQYGMDGLAGEVEVDAALAGQGMKLFESAKLPADVKGAHYQGIAVYRAGLTAGERCAVKAHELAHFELHHGNGLYLANMDRRHLLVDRREREATIFAGTLLIGSPRRADFNQALHDAHEGGLPLDFLFAYLHGLVLHADDEDRFVSLDRMDIDREALLAEPLSGEHRQRIWNRLLTAVVVGLPLLGLDWASGVQRLLG